ncbi:MAG: hypothetical protein VB119_03685 [Candidatus Metalachnospira sp.]|nr:hypothetical protein [Candidatus Metalachnospira sp.]
MRKIRYVIPKREKIFVLLLLLLLLSSIYVFAVGINFSPIYRYIIYLECVVGIFEVFLLNLILQTFIYVVRVDEDKFIFSSPFRKIAVNVPFESITKVIINKTRIRVFFIKTSTENSTETNTETNTETSTETSTENNTENSKELEVIIPLIQSGFIHMDDFLYIMNLFKDIEIEYNDTIQEKVLESISKQIYKHHKIVVYIASIGTLFILSSNLVIMFVSFFVK